jgi:hypothetical protein
MIGREEQGQDALATMQPQVNRRFKGYNRVHTGTV